MENNLDIKSQFVPYEIAVKLEEIGFDEPCFYVKLKDSPEHWYTPTDYEDYPEQKSKEVLIPLWQQAAQFLSDISSNQINITINGKDNYEELCEKFKKAIEDFRNL